MPSRDVCRGLGEVRDRSADTKSSPDAAYESSVLSVAFLRHELRQRRTHEELQLPVSSKEAIC